MDRYELRLGSECASMMVLLSNLSGWLRLTEIKQPVQKTHGDFFFFLTAVHGRRGSCARLTFS